MNELKDSFKNKFISNTFINQSLIDEHCVTDSNGVTECNTEITGIDPTSYPAHLCIEESIHVKFDEESYTDEKVAHSSSIFQELLSCPYDEVSHTEEEATILDPIILYPNSFNQDTAVSSTTHLSDANETLENEDSPATDVPFSNKTSVSNLVELASGHQDHPVNEIIGNLHDGVQTKSRVSNNFFILIPAPNSPPLPIYIKATNVVFNPDIPDVHRGLGLDDFVNFLVSCRLRYAISDVPSEFFPEQVCEFYYTAMMNDENNVISGTIGHGRHSVFITADLLSAALRLPIFEPFSELLTIEHCRRLFDQLGYDHSKAGA
ncbi:unnamed protein product [Lactuca saligna]|uniref:Uncharacterized protein n=1 Tax=Lactuca saligna TaxID=75948 RepID=A0AA35VC03_LACSI|nr:unnamed protein product [Lactuca saligna]